MPRYRRESPKKLGAKMLQIRLWLDMTQEEVAKHLKTDSGSISRYERGLRDPSLLELLAFSRMSGAGMELLVDDKMNLPKKAR